MLGLLWRTWEPRYWNLDTSWKAIGELGSSCQNLHDDGQLMNSWDPGKPVVQLHFIERKNCPPISKVNTFFQLSFVDEVEGERAVSNGSSSSSSGPATRQLVPGLLYINHGTATGKKVRSTSIKWVLFHCQFIYLHNSANKYSKTMF